MTGVQSASTATFPFLFGEAFIEAGCGAGSSAAFGISLLFRRDFH